MWYFTLDLHDLSLLLLKEMKDDRHEIGWIGVMKMAGPGDLMRMISFSHAMKLLSVSNIK